MAEHESAEWAHLKAIARRVSAEFPDAVFIGGIATYYYAFALGSEFLEASHDADLYLSLAGKSDLRDRYEVRRSPNRNMTKDSVVVDGEDLDLYVEHQHSLAVPYAEAFAYSDVINGVRVASLEHLLVLKLDAARDRWSSAKGEKDIRDIAKIVALLEKPRAELLRPYYSPERDQTLAQVAARNDIPQLLGLDAFHGSRFKKTIDERINGIRSSLRSAKGFQS